MKGRRGPAFGAIAFGAIAFAVSLLSGCSDTVCVQWSAEEGACPSQSDAVNFVDSCAVTSVDSEGEFEEDACCYDATYSDEEYCGI